MPEIIAQSREEFDAFKDGIIRFNQGGPYSDRELVIKYTALMKKWIRIAGKDGSVFADWGCLKSKQERNWLETFPALPHDLLLRLDPSDATAPLVSPMSPNNAEHVRYLHERLSAVGDPHQNEMISMIELERYWKVYRTYYDAVEFSLLYGLMIGGENVMDQWADEYRQWFPETDRALQGVRRKLQSQRQP